jgi:hypothetical protein
MGVVLLFAQNSLAFGGVQVVMSGDWRRPPHDASSSLLRPAFTSPQWHALFGGATDDGDGTAATATLTSTSTTSGSGVVCRLQEPAPVLGRDQVGHARLLAALRVGDRQAPVVHALARATARGLHSVAPPPLGSGPDAQLDAELAVARQFGGVLLLPTRQAASALNDCCLRSLPRFEPMVTRVDDGATPAH